MNNISDIRKEFARIYGIPGCNCKNRRADSFAVKFKPLLIFLAVDFFFIGGMRGRTPAIYKFILKILFATP